jgi:hypothetical protein
VELEGSNLELEMPQPQSSFDAGYDLEEPMESLDDPFDGLEKDNENGIHNDSNEVQEEGVTEE